MNNTAEWLDRITGNLSNRKVAIELGVTNTALSRWVRDEKMTAEWVITIARHYEANVVEALSATGHITKEEAAEAVPGASIRTAASTELSAELHMRLLADESARRIAADDTRSVA